MEPDEPGFGPAGLKNELSYDGEARYVSTIPNMSGGILRIIPDILIFRGDANHDGAVDMSDAATTLNWLFLGGPCPVCLDEADANDDGKLDVSDPIAILNTLFLGGSSIAPPYPGRGIDGTADDLPPCL
jgi:hypothetical protein